MDKKLYDRINELKIRMSSAHRDNKIFYENIEDFKSFLIRHGFSTMIKKDKNKIGQVRCYKNKLGFIAKTVQITGTEKFYIIIKNDNE